MTDLNDVRMAKIKRLLALAEHNSNPNEGAAALAHAQKLMRKYGMSTDDVALSAIGELRKETVCGLKDKETVCTIAYICAAVFGTDYIFNCRGKSFVSVTFIGVKENLPLVGYVYDFLCRQVLNAKKAYQIKCKKRLIKQAQDLVDRLMPKGSATYERLVSIGVDPLQNAYGYLELNKKFRRLTKSYLQGYLRAVELKVQEFYDERTVKLIELYKSKHYQDLSALKLREQKFDGRALNAGLRDGNDVNLLHPVSGQTSSSQLSYF